MGENATLSPEQNPDKPEGARVQKSGIKKEVEKFISATDSLVATAPLALWAIEAAHRGAYKEYMNFWQTKCVNIREEDKQKVADVPPDLIHEYRVLQRRLDRSSIATKVIANSAIVSLVSEYDSFLGCLLRTFLRRCPELLNASERTLTLKELQGFESIGAARDFIIDKEVETVIRKSHVEQFEWMENRFGVKLRVGLDVLPTFVEVTERRNLLVHCGGIVSSNYLSVCQQRGIDCAETGVGTELTVSRAYLVKAYECLVEIGVKLAHVLWRKLIQEERAEADESLNLLCLDLMLENHNALAKSLLDFSTGVLKKWSTEVNRLLFVVNRAQAYKWANQDVICQKILRAEDWSAVDDRLSLGVAILKDDFEAAVTLMRKIGVGPLVPKDSYRQWPIFKQFRKSTEFRSAYKNIFGEDFADVPEQNTITFKLEWNPPSVDGKAQTSNNTPKPN